MPLPDEVTPDSIAELGVEGLRVMVLHLAAEHRKAVKAFYVEQAAKEAAETRVELITLDQQRMATRLKEYRLFAQQWRQLVVGPVDQLLTRLDDEPTARPGPSLAEGLLGVSVLPGAQAFSQRWLEPDGFGGERLVQPLRYAGTDRHVERPEPLKADWPRGTLPGMVRGTEGWRVVHCGEQCRAGHTYSAPCLMSLPRDPKQVQRHPERRNPSHRERMMEAEPMKDTGRPIGTGVPEVPKGEGDGAPAE